MWIHKRVKRRCWLEMLKEPIHHTRHVMASEQSYFWIIFFFFFSKIEIKLSICKWTKRKLWKTVSNDMVCWSRQHHYKFFIGCLSQILPGSFMNNFYNNPLNQNFVSSIFGQCSHLITPGTFARNSSKLTAKEYEKKVYVYLKF